MELREALENLKKAQRIFSKLRENRALSWTQEVGLYHIVSMLEQVETYARRLEK